MRLGRMEIGSNVGQQPDRDVFRRVKNESGKGQSDHGKPFRQEALLPILNHFHCLLQYKSFPDFIRIFGYEIFPIVVPLLRRRTARLEKMADRRS